MDDRITSGYERSRRKDQPTQKTGRMPEEEAECVMLLREEGGQSQRIKSMRPIEQAVPSKVKSDNVVARLLTRSRQNPHTI